VVAITRGPVRGAPPDAEPLAPLPHLGGAGRAAYVRGHLARADLGEGGEGGGGGGAGAEDRGGFDLPHLAFAQGGHHAGDIGVVAEAAAVIGEDDGVDGLDGGRGVADCVEQRDHGTLERHGEGEPGPGVLLGFDLLQETGQGGLVDLEAVVGPAGQAEFGIGGAVQHRGEGVLDGRSEDRRAVSMGH
jgi:hypothetical protein